MTLAVLLILGSSGALGAQGAATASLSGVVMDSGGGVIPGAAVVVRNNATTIAFDVVTNSTGVFALPALNAGTYTVTVSLMGFKTAVVSDVKREPCVRR